MGLKFTNLLNKLLFISLFTGLTTLGFAQQKNQVVEQIIAKVDNEIILQSDLDIAYLQFLSSSSFYGENLRCKVLETLIINKLLIAKAEIDSVTVEPENINSQLDRRMAMLLQRYRGDEEALQKQYGKTISELKDELYEQVEEQLIIQKMQRKITADVSITPLDVKRFFNSIPKDSLPYFSTELEVGQIVIKPRAGTASKKKAKTLLEGLKNQIKNGTDFSELAKKHSQDPGSAPYGGELGFFKRGQLVPEYDATALNLQPGELSEIVESQFGFHLIQMIEKRGNEYNSRHILIRADESSLDLEATRLQLDSLKSAIENDSVTFSKAAYDFTEDPATKPTGGFFLDPQTGSSRVSAENLDASLYFIVNKMKVGDISAPMDYRTADGKQALRIVYLKEKLAPHEANLRDDYQKIYNAALEEKKNKALNEWFTNTKKEVFIEVIDDYKNCEILVNP
ncbi:MAG: peptidylprolyl isomerase [Cytophagales bacterium]|nr:peptidylprolyl isomerase [Cytophagales bacterium]